jgi:SprT protein
MGKNLNHRLIALAESAVRKAEQKARTFYQIDLPASHLSFSLKGHCAGQATVDRFHQTFIRLNFDLLRDHTDAFLCETIPHEVAHLVVNLKALGQGTKPRPHGAEWVNVMQECFGLKGRRCHNYPSSPARVVPRKYVYSCQCREHYFTAIMHKRLSGNRYAICKGCQTKLVHQRS